MVPPKPQRQSSASAKKILGHAARVARLVKYNSMEFSALGGSSGYGKRFAFVESGRCPMLACNRLRLDPGDGSPVVDYRIENGCVESRTLETAAESSTATEKQWQRLTLEQLGFHVMADTVVAHWLHRRMGVHRLIRACTQHSSSANNGVQECSDRIAA